MFHREIGSSKYEVATTSSVDSHIPWVRDVITSLTFALQLCQSLKDKVSVKFQMSLRMALALNVAVVLYLSCSLSAPLSQPPPLCHNLYNYVTTSTSTSQPHLERHREAQFKLVL